MNLKTFLNMIYEKINNKLSTAQLLAIACSLSFLLVLLSVAISMELMNKEDDKTPVIAISEYMNDTAEDNYIKVASDIENLKLANDYYKDSQQTMSPEEVEINTKDLSRYSFPNPMAEKIKNEIPKNIKPTRNFAISKPDSLPVMGRVTSRYGIRRDPLEGYQDFHKGLDIAASEGSKIRASGSGIVTYSGKNGTYGNLVIISHGYGYRSLYAHNKKNLVKVGDKVKKGDIIALVGNTGKSTGPHVHFEIHYKGKQINPEVILN